MRICVQLRRGLPEEESKVRMGGKERGTVGSGCNWKGKVMQDAVGLVQWEVHAGGGKEEERKEWGVV